MKELSFDTQNNELVKILFWAIGDGVFILNNPHAPTGTTKNETLDFLENWS